MQPTQKRNTAAAPSSQDHTGQDANQSNAKPGVDDGNQGEQLALSRRTLGEITTRSTGENISGSGNIWNQDPKTKHKSYVDLTHEVAKVACAWGEGERVLPGPLCEELRRILPRVLVDSGEHEAYMKALRETRKGIPHDEPLSYLSNPVDLPIDALIASGIAVLRDDELAVLALDEIDLNTLPELIDCMLDSGELGKAWIDEMVRVGDEAYPELREQFTVKTGETPNGS